MSIASLNLCKAIEYEGGIGSLERGLNNIKKAILKEFPEYEIEIDAFRATSPDCYSYVSIEINGTDEPTNELFDGYWNDIDVYPNGKWISGQSAGMKTIKEAILEEIRKHEEERFDN